MKLTSREKNNVFWYFLVPVLLFLTLFISLSPWLLELLATPPNQIFSGINRWSVDYYIYLSYVELGRRGEIPARLLMTTAAQIPFYTHLIYTLPGFIFGKILGLNAVLIYHFIRSVYGLIFIFLSLYFFYRFSKSKTIALIAFFLTFYVAGFAKIESFFPFRASRPLTWIQEQNIIGRATGPSHYSLGMVTFLLVVLWFFLAKAKPIKKTLIFGLLLNLVLFTNPFAFIVIGLSFGLYLLIQALNRYSGLISQTVVMAAGFALTLPYFFYLNYHLSIPPWGNTSMAPKYYVVLHPPIFLKEAFLSIGPTFLLAFLAVLVIVLGKIKNPLTKNQFIFLVSWLIGQFFLFFFGDLVKIDPVRSFNTLYYLPLCLLSAILIFSLAKTITKSVLILGLLFFLTLPNLCLAYKEQLYAFTDFISFQPLSFPTRKQVEAFNFLEKNTPVASGVLAMYEASSLVPAFSANTTELGMEHAAKANFYAGQMTPDQAYQFLKNNRFSYIYFGYQERSVGDYLNRYPFLKLVFQNEEVSLYQVR